MHSAANPCPQANSARRASKEDKQTFNTTKNPSRCLTPENRIKGCIHGEQDLHFPPAPYSPAPESHLSDLKQFKQGTEVTKQTAAGAIGSTRFTLNGFTYYFTFFSKFFSSFPHGTCSLSVSGKYYSFRRNIPPTLCCSPKQHDSQYEHYRRSQPLAITGLLPSTARCLNNELSSSATCRYSTLDHNSHAQRRGFSD